MTGLSALRGAVAGPLSRLLPKAVGYVDHFDMDRIAGWAVDPDGSGKPPVLSLHVDGAHVMNVAANLPRDDVAQTGRAPLRCGFDIALPQRLRDGAAHLVEVRLGADGPRLRGGRRQIAAGTAGRGAVGRTAQAIEGVVWFDRARAGLAGWATGCGSIAIAIDGGTAEDVPLDREVPGLGAGNRQGFFLPLPDTLADGAVHRIEARAGNWIDAIALDGSPMDLRLGAARPRLSVRPTGARQVTLDLTDRAGGPSVPPVHLRLDGVTLPEGTPDAEGRIALTLPEDARHLTVATAPAEVTAETPAAVLGRYVIGPDGHLQEWSADLPRPELDSDPLPETLLAEARAAWDGYVADPDGRFDATWVATAAGLTDTADALPHWRDTGAGAGLPPGPAFDEIAARTLHPGIARAIAEGALPCAFAAELVLGAGTLGTMTGLAIRRAGAAPAAAHATDNAPVAATLPPITTWCAPTDSIYAAWLARLDTDADTRAAIEADERAARVEVASAPLTRQPLVSIIMPSWNRAFTIGEAIQSVIEQSYPNWELLICDDASEDRTADVVRDFKDDRIRYMRFQKSNGAGARNHGLRRAAGEYVAYLDSDNMWHPLFLDLMLRRLMGAPGVPIAYGAYLDTETRGAAVHLAEISRPTFRPVQLSSKNFMDLNSIVHHRRVLDWLGGFDGALPRLQDWDLVLRHTSVFGAQFVDRIGVFYRRNIAWGQVTQTQQGSGAQDTVNAKTQARLAPGGHVRLDIDWPARSRVTLLCGPDAAPAMFAGLRALAGRLGDVDVVAIGGDRPDARVLDAHVLSDPQRLGAEIADLVQAPVIALGLDDALLASVPGLLAERVLRPVTRDTGLWLEPLSDPRAAFPLGALPLNLPQRADDTRGGPVLVLGASDDDWHAALTDHGLTALVPPGAHGTGWMRVAEGGNSPEPAEQGLIPALSDVAACVVLGPVEDLPPLHFALLAAMQGAGVPLALPGSDAPDSLAQQWIAARAVYEVKSPKPEWIFEKLSKLLGDANTLARLSERSHTVHRIALAPELAEERMAHVLWRHQFAPPRIEVLDGA